MKICDKHSLSNPKEGKWTVLVEIEGMEYNLCDECYLEWMEWVNTKPKQKRKRTLFGKDDDCRETAST